MLKKNKTALPILVIFFLINAILISFKKYLVAQNVDVDIVLVANAILFASNMLTIFLLQKALKNSNPNVFIQAMMGGTLIKLIVIATALIIYVVLVKNKINKPAIYISILLYFIYLVAEVLVMLKLNKKKNA